MKGFYLPPKNFLMWVTVWIITGSFQFANGALLAKDRLRMANPMPSDSMTLWYDRPVTLRQCANPWMDYALPIGNGQLGGMVYGGVKYDTL